MAAHLSLAGDKPNIIVVIFDLDSQLEQRTDVSREHPAVFERLKKTVIEWHGEVMADGPTWEVPERISGKPKIWDSY